MYHDTIIISYFIDNHLTNTNEPRVCDKTILRSINLIKDNSISLVIYQINLLKI